MTSYKNILLNWSLTFGPNVPMIRSEITFPSCWDGRLSTADPAGDPHVVHPEAGWAAGTCPPSHSRRLPTLFFEALFTVRGVFEAGDQ